MYATNAGQGVEWGSTMIGCQTFTLGLYWISDDFVYVVLSPNSTRSALGEGWCGVELVLNIQISESHFERTHFERT